MSMLRGDAVVSLPGDVRCTGTVPDATRKLPERAQFRHVLGVQFRGCLDYEPNPTLGFPGLCPSLLEDNHVFLKWEGGNPVKTKVTDDTVSHTIFLVFHFPST